MNDGTSETFDGFQKKLLTEDDLTFLDDIPGIQIKEFLTMSPMLAITKWAFSTRQAVRIFTEEKFNEVGRYLAYIERYYPR